MDFSFMDTIRAERRKDRSDKVVKKLKTSRVISEDYSGYDPKRVSDADRDHGAHFSPISKALTRKPSQHELDEIERNWRLNEAIVEGYRRWFDLRDWLYSQEVVDESTTD